MINYHQMDQFTTYTVQRKPAHLVFGKRVFYSDNQKHYLQENVIVVNILPNQWEVIDAHIYEENYETYSNPVYHPIYINVSTNNVECRVMAEKLVCKPQAFVRLPFYSMKTIIDMIQEITLNCSVTVPYILSISPSYVYQSQLINRVIGLHELLPRLDHMHVGNIQSLLANHPLLQLLQ